MDSVESEGRSVDEAVERGLQQLGCSRDEVKVEVLEKGTGGIRRFFGGGRSARVRLVALSDQGERIRNTVANLLKAMDLAAQVSVERHGDTHAVAIDTAGVDGLLIGRKGDTLTALQHIIDRMVNHGRDDRVKVNVDVGGYRGRRHESLRTRAMSLASQVKATGRERSTDPLSPPDRRIVHLTLSGDAAIRTYTVGEGTYRTVVIAPAESRAGARGARDRQGAGPTQARRSAEAAATVGGGDDEDDG